MVGVPLTAEMKRALIYASSETGAESLAAFVREAALVWALLRSTADIGADGERARFALRQLEEVEAASV